jgi:hypothetical protein
VRLKSPIATKVFSFQIGTSDLFPHFGHRAYYQIMNTAQLLDPKPTANQVKAALAVTLAVAEAIREAGEIPSGTLYSMLISKVDLQGYEAMIRNLKNAGLVEEKAHLLKWIGPILEAK